MRRVVVVGANGRMGGETVRAIDGSSEMELVAGVGRGDDLGVVLDAAKPEILVDFTLPESTMAVLRAGLSRRIVCISGTTGFTPENLTELSLLCVQHDTPCLIAPNFAIGAVLLMRFAADAAKYLPDAEIIEMHHERKKDAPSGTAIRTAEIIANARKTAPLPPPAGAFELADGARGGRVGDVPVHSVRLPGFVASQEVIFGAPGQRLTIRHDSIDRASFMPGVLLAVRECHRLTGLTIGLEHLL